jgi:hypothetical protein
MNIFQKKKGGKEEKGEKKWYQTRDEQIYKI